MSAPVTPSRSPWDVPYPYGQSAAIDSMGGIAAPLLAGFAVTLAVFVMSTPQTFRWVEPTLALLLVAALALVASLQFTFRASQWSVTASEITDWWPDMNDSRLEELRSEQLEHRHLFMTWANAARIAYDIGILFFVFGLAIAMFPHGSVSSGRLVVICIALAGAGAEFFWIAHDLTPSGPANN